MLLKKYKNIELGERYITYDNQDIIIIAIVEMNNKIYIAYRYLYPTILKTNRLHVIEVIKQYKFLYFQNSYSFNEYGISKFMRRESYVDITR